MLFHSNLIYKSTTLKECATNEDNLLLHDMSMGVMDDYYLLLRSSMPVSDWHSTISAVLLFVHSTSDLFQSVAAEQLFQLWKYLMTNLSSSIQHWKI